MKALLALEDGRTFPCRSFTGAGEVGGEVVFNTAMSGYQEVLTDPSYSGQLVTMTYPLIGNYGVNIEDVESDRVQVAAFIIREYQPHYSNYRASSSLADYLVANRIVGVDSLDTRALTLHIRNGGAMRAMISTEQIDSAALVAKARTLPSMAGLDLARQIVEPARHERLRSELEAQRRKLGAAPAAAPAPAAPVSATRSSILPVVAEPPQPPDFERHVIANTPLPQIWKFVNPLMLYGRHLGLKGALARAIGVLEERGSAARRAEAGGRSMGVDPRELAKTEEGQKALELERVVAEVQADCQASALMKPAAVYQFFRAEGEGNRLRLRDPAGRELAAFEFQRQPRPDGVCLADLVNPPGAAPDAVCLFVVTAGAGIRARAEELKQQGDYLKSHVLQALALETAEAYAELLHAMVRSLWGFPDGLEITMQDRFKAQYRGKRYSFGYPACPRLEDQEILFGLLRPAEIGVQLTDGCMMDPEASVSALVFHHPQATYFSAHAGGPSGAAPDGPASSDAPRTPAPAPGAHETHGPAGSARE